jgi:hypothetical protein
MSTAATTHHRYSDPLAIAAAVAVIVGGATVIGIAVNQNDATTPTAPAAPVHGKVAVKHPSRVGMGDFRQSPENAGHPTPLKGGHTVNGQP